MLCCATMIKVGGKRQQWISSLNMSEQHDDHPDLHRSMTDLVTEIMDSTPARWTASAAVQHPGHRYETYPALPSYHSATNSRSTLMALNMLEQSSNGPLHKLGPMSPAVPYEMINRRTSNPQGFRGFCSLHPFSSSKIICFLLASNFYSTKIFEPIISS